MDDQTGSPELFLFLASTAHDMKNSVSVLSGTLESMLADGSAKTEASYPKMAQMLYQTKRLNDNLIQLLALYKQVGKPAYPFDVQAQQLSQFAAQVLSMVHILLDTKGIVLETDIPEDLIWYFDEDLILGVVGHAINNAIHYTSDKIRLAIVKDGDYLEFRVEDNGRGFPPSMIEAGVSAMDGLATGVDFATNSTGLGLYFSSEVAKMHKHRERGGSVVLENGGALGGGCFVLRLP